MERLRLVAVLKVDRLGLVSVLRLNVLWTSCVKYDKDSSVLDTHSWAGADYGFLITRPTVTVKNLAVVYIPPDPRLPPKSKCRASPPFRQYQIILVDDKSTRV